MNSGVPNGPIRFVHQAGARMAAFLRDFVRRKKPEKRPFGPLAAVLPLAIAVLFCLAACGPFGQSAMLLAPQKARQAALARRPDSFSRLAAAEENAPEQTAVPVFAAFFGGRRAAAQAYCDEMSGGLKVPAVEGCARAWLWAAELSVSELLQLPQLRNGCEATSLAALLNYYGVAADKMELAYEYIPREDFIDSPYGRIGPDPARAYPGDPATESGFYCFAAPLVQGANRYLREKGVSMYAVNIPGVTEEGLRQYIRGGDPVAVWVTLDLSEPYTGGFAWIIENTGQAYTPYLNLHCVVLMGWGRDTCTLMDPLQGVCTVDRQAFLASFEQLGRRALVVR